MNVTQHRYDYEHNSLSNFHVNVRGTTNAVLLFFLSLLFFYLGEKTKKTKQIHVCVVSDAV